MPTVEQTREQLIRALSYVVSNDLAFQYVKLAEQVFREDERRKILSK